MTYPSFIAYFTKGSTAMAFNDIIGTADLTDQQIPDQEINEILQTAPEKSVMLTRARQVRMSARKTKQSVLTTLPDAFWVDGDTGLKQTSKSAWSGIQMTAEELAVIVPIPDSVVSDASIPLWTEVRPLIAEAIGKKVDEACLFGADKPASWPTGIVPAAIAAGNVATLSDTSGSEVSLTDAFLQIAEDASVGGSSVNGFITRPGLNWRLRGLKDNQGQYIFGSPTQGGNATLYGQTLDEVRNGAWDPAVAEAVALDWSKFIIGIRQDVTYDIFREGVISDATGKVILNLMQQDTQALRVVFRVGFQVAQPLTRLGNPYPAGVIAPDVTP